MIHYWSLVVLKEGGNTMARVTRDEVVAIMDNCNVSTAVINDLIDLASALVDKVFINDPDMSSTLLAGVEKYLTAHMIALGIERSTKDEKIGDAAISYTGKWGMKLDATPYGQMAQTLDITGKLTKAGKAAASLYAIKSTD